MEDWHPPLQRRLSQPLLSASTSLPVQVERGVGVGVSVLQGFLSLPAEVMLLGGEGRGGLSHCGNREWFGAGRAAPKQPPDPPRVPAGHPPWDTHGQASYSLGHIMTCRDPGHLGCLGPLPP